MKKIVFICLFLFAIAASLSASETFPGYVKRIYTDPDAITFEMKDAGGNTITHNGGDIFFVFTYSQENAKFLYTLLISSLLQNRSIMIFSDGFLVLEDGTVITSRKHVTHAYIQ